MANCAVDAGQAREQILLEIVQIKLSSFVNISKADRKLLIGYVEAQYAPKKKHRTKESKLYGGTKFGIPLDGSLSGVTLFVFIMDNHPGLTIDIGRSAINLPDGLDLSSLDSTPTDCSAIMTKFKGKEKVGRVSYRISKISLFTDGNNKDSFNDSKTVPEAEDINVLCPLPDFRFNRLTKPIHWERLKGLNLDRIVHGVDLTTLMTVVDDVALGDVSQEDVDHKLLKTLQISQYSVQYLLSCQKAMKKNKSIINDTLRVFDDEEVMLDLRLARMRTRSKALKRESASLDTLHSEYSELLLTIDPILMKAYKKSLHADSSSKKRFLNDFTSGVDGIARTDLKSKSSVRSQSGLKTVAISVEDDIYGNGEHGSERKSSSIIPVQNSLDTWATHNSNERSQADSSNVRENKNKWAGNGTWESGSTVPTGQRLRKRSEEDSDSVEDSEEGPKSPSSRVRVAAGAGASISAEVKEGADRMPLEKGPSDKDVDREKGKDRMSTTLDKPRVTFDSSSNFSKSEFDSKPVQSSKHANDDDDDDDEVYRDSLNISPRRSRGEWGDIDKKNDRKKNNRKQSMSDKYDDDDDDNGADTNRIDNDFKRSSAWSTMETQLSAMSADSLGFTALKSPTLDQNTTVDMSQNAMKKKVLQDPEISVSPDSRSSPKPYNDNTDIDGIDDMEIISLDGPSNIPMKRVERSSLKPLRIDVDESGANYSAVFPEFTPVAAVVTTKWRENDIGEVILKSRQYDSDSSRNSPASSRSASPSPSGQVHTIPQSNANANNDDNNDNPSRGFSPQSESDSDISPLVEKGRNRTSRSSYDVRDVRDVRDDLVADSWAAGKETNKFNAFFRITSGGIAMTTEQAKENQTDNRKARDSNQSEGEDATTSDIHKSASIKKSAYADFIKNSGKGNVAEKMSEEGAFPLINKLQVELRPSSAEIPRTSSGSRSLSMDALGEYKNSRMSLGSNQGRLNEGEKEVVKRRMSQMQEHEDAFERPSRSSLSSTFPIPFRDGQKQQLEQIRLSGSNGSTFNSDDGNLYLDDENENEGEEEGDVIDTSTSVTLDFFAIGKSPSLTDKSKGDQTGNKKGNTVAFMPAEEPTNRTLSPSGDGRGGEGKVRGPGDALGGTERLEAKRAGASKDLHFTMRDGDERSGSRADQGSSNRPDSNEEQDDDVLYGTIRFGGTRSGQEDGDKMVKSSLKASDAKRNLNSSTPFSTLSPANWQRQSSEVKVNESNSNSSNGSNFGTERQLDENLDSSFQPSESANSLNFNLSQSTVLCDIDKLNIFIDNKQKKREDSTKTEDNDLDEDGGEGEDSGQMDQHTDDTESPSLNDELSGLEWRAGRAPTELIETGRAFDVFVSALKLHDESFLSVRLQLEFLGLRSALSPMIPHTAITSVQPVNFSSHISSAPEIVTLLTDEIQAEGEYLSFRINLRDVSEAGEAEQEQCDEEKEDILAQGSVALWVMIEDSCSILRQEVDILDCVSEEVIGFAVVDVRGHRLLKECS